MKTPPTTKSAGGFVLNPDGKVLMVEEFGRYWGLPRGHIEEGESPLATALREISEETGVSELEFVADLGSYTRSTFDKDGKPNYREIKHITMYCFRTRQTNLAPRDPDITDARWFTLDEARARLINAKDVEFFDEVIARIKYLP